MLFEATKYDTKIFENNNKYMYLIINCTLTFSFILSLYLLIFYLEYAVIYAVINLILVKLSDSYIMYKNAKDYLDNLNVDYKSI